MLLMTELQVGRDFRSEPENVSPNFIYG